MLTILIFYQSEKKEWSLSQSVHNMDLRDGSASNCKMGRKNYPPITFMSRKATIVTNIFVVTSHMYIPALGSDRPFRIF